MNIETIVDDKFTTKCFRELVEAPISALRGVSPSDARALLRAEARELRSEILAAQNKPWFSKEARAHLAESYSTLDEAIRIATSTASGNIARRAR